VPTEPARPLSKWDRAEEGGSPEEKGGQPPPLPGPLANSRWATEGVDDQPSGTGSPEAGGGTLATIKGSVSEDGGNGAGARAAGAVPPEGGSSDEDVFQGFGAGNGGAGGPSATPQGKEGVPAATAATTPHEGLEGAGGAGAEKVDAVEEGRRQRLRQVCYPCSHLAESGCSVQ